MRRLVTGLLFGAGVLLASSTARATVYDEAVNGDLSNSGAAPTTIAVTSGSNTVTATSQSGDIEYFKMTIPTGSALSAINVISNTSTSLSFIAVQSGSTFTEPPTGTNVANLLGYAHFGVGNSTIGTNILPTMGSQGGSPHPINFTPPLPAGTYTFWSQETSGSPSTYKLDFVVSQAAPIPPGFYLVLAGALSMVGMWSVRRRARPLAKV